MGPLPSSHGDQKDGTRRDRGRRPRGCNRVLRELGLKPGGTGQVEGKWVDRIIALHGSKAELAMLRTPDGDVEIELVKFHSPPTQGGDPHAPSNTPGIRHLSFLVEDIDDVVAGLQVRGTEGIIVELAEKIG